MVSLNDKLIYIMVGYPGSGKSTLAKKIAKWFKCEYLSSDLTRQRFFSTSRFDTAGDSTIVEQRKQLYPKMYSYAKDLALNNKKVVIDATHLDQEMRDTAFAVLSDKIPKETMCFVIVNPPYETIEERMRKKQVVKNTPTESVYEAWQRVYKLFKQREKRGLVSWPTNQLGIDMVDYTYVYKQLDQHS